MVIPEGHKKGQTHHRHCSQVIIEIHKVCVGSIFSLIVTQANAGLWQKQKLWTKNIQYKILSLSVNSASIDGSLQRLTQDPSWTLRFDVVLDLLLRRGSGLHENPVDYSEFETNYTVLFLWGFILIEVFWTNPSCTEHLLSSNLHIIFWNVRNTERIESHHSLLFEWVMCQTRHSEEPKSRETPGLDTHCMRGSVYTDTSCAPSQLKLTKNYLT